MCGRYYRRSDKQKIAETFHVAQVDDFALPPWDFNVAPTTQQPIIRNNRDTGERELVSLRWGLIPFFTKSLALRLAFTGHTAIPRESEIDFLTEAEPAFGPPQPKKTATKKAKAMTPISAAEKTAAKKTTAKNQVAA